MNDWNNIAMMIGSNWRSFADFAISTSLSNCIRVVNQPNNTTLYKGIVQIKNSKGVVVATYYPEIIRAVTDGNIITAYPTSKR